MLKEIVICEKRGEGFIKVKGGWVGGWEREGDGLIKVKVGSIENIYIIPEEIRVLYRSVKLIRGHTKTTEALLQTIALAIHWVVRGG